MDKLNKLNQSYKKAISRCLLNNAAIFGVIEVSDVLLEPTKRAANVWVIADDLQLRLLNSHKAKISTELNKLVESRFTPKIIFHKEDGSMGRIDSMLDEISNAN